MFAAAPFLTLISSESSNLTNKITQSLGSQKASTKGLKLSF